MGNPRSTPPSFGRSSGRRPWGAWVLAFDHPSARRSCTLATHFIDHIDLRVRSLVRARPFYDAFLGALGLHRITGDDALEWAGYAYGHEEPISTPFFGLMPDPGHLGNATRIAFAADSRAEVDTVAAAVRAAGAAAVEGPELCLEYHPTYYAVFFEDGDGNRFEVCCHREEA